MVETEAGTSSGHIFKLVSVVAAVIAVGAGAWGYSQHQNAEQATASLVAMHGQVVQLQDHATQLEQQVKQLEAHAAQIEQQAAANDAAAAKHDLPVSVSFHRAIMGQGLVAKFQNNSGGVLEVAAVFSSPNNAKRKETNLVINPNATAEIGHAQGWAFAPGQSLTLSNTKYRTLVITVPGNR